MTASTHDHNFLTSSQQNERKVMAVFILTIITMIAEIIVGTWSGSMALLADGWHMGTHAAAFSLALFTYRFARKHANNRDFSFGTGKVSYLGGFASAIGLGIVALLMAVESIMRLIQPEQIHFSEAIIVAFVGLAVNVISVFILHDNHDHHNHDHHDDDDDQQHGNGHSHSHQHDHNIKAAYFHVLADALTSILAIAALFAGLYFGWLWMDAVMGIIGAIIITKWALGLIKDTSHVLLDKNAAKTPNQKIIDAIESQHEATVTDLHIWTIAEGHKAAILELSSQRPTDMQTIKTQLKNLEPALSHISIQIN